MSSRIDVELTSTRDDGTWTWRAAGARQPKGVLRASLLPPDPKLGQVLRVEVETGLDGLEVVAVVPPKKTTRSAGPREAARKPRTARPAPPPRPKAKRLRPGRTHRNEVLAALPPEQRPVAEQVLRGGIPAVRQGIEKQNETARAEGRPEVKA